jgi:hypothetical protein
MERKEAHTRREEHQGVQLASNAALMMVASRQCLVTGRSDIPGSFFDVGPRILFVMAIFGRQTATHPMILCSLARLRRGRGVTGSPGVRHSV